MIEQAGQVIAHYQKQGFDRHVIVRRIELECSTDRRTAADLYADLAHKLQTAQQLLESA